MPVIDVHQHLVQYEAYEPGYRKYLEETNPDYFGPLTGRFSQPAEIDRMLARYSHLSDDSFVRENLNRWLN